MAATRNEVRITDASAHCVGYLNFVPDTLLVEAMFRIDKQDLACLVASVRHPAGVASPGRRVF